MGRCGSALPFGTFPSETTIETLAMVLSGSSTRCTDCTPVRAGGSTLDPGDPRLASSGTSFGTSLMELPGEP